MFNVATPYSARTLQREMVDAAEVPMPYLARLAAQVHHYDENGAALAYLDLLDRAIADLTITVDERRELLQLVHDLGLDADDVDAVHQRYIDELVAAAMRDGVISDTERSLLERAAAALQVEAGAIAATADASSGAAAVTLKPGMTVCFTGAATYPGGTELPRARLEEIAQDLNLTPTSSVTKKGCGLLVASDPYSQSGKAAKARKYGIPVAAVSDFLTAQPGSRLPAVWAT